MNRVTFTEARDRMTGQWQPCLEAMGIPPEAFEKGNHPCVFCGGTDRANYGNRQHPETYYCRQCADRGLDGFGMLQEWHGWTAVEALQAVAGWLGMGYHDNVIPFTRAHPRPLQAQLTKPLPDHRDRIRRIWQEAVPLTSDAARVARAYFDSRGLAGLPAMPRDVHCHLALTYWWRNPDGEPVPLGTFPALVSLIRSIDGRVKGLHRTYLQPDGRGKVRLFEDWKRVQLPAKKTVAVSDGATRGCAVHLFPMSAAGVRADHRQWRWRSGWRR